MTAVAALALAALAALVAVVVLGRRVQAQVGFLGADGTQRLVVGYGAIAAGVAFSAAVLPASLRRWHSAAALVSATGWAAFVTVRSGVLTDALLAAAVGITCWLLGRAITNRLGIVLPVAWPIELTAGAGLLAVLVLLAGQAGLIASWSVGATVLAIPLVAALLQVRRLGPAPAAYAASTSAGAALAAIARTRFSAGCFGLLAVTAGAAVVWTSAPEIQFDAVYAKAWLPSQWAAEGRISPSLDHPVLNVTGAAQLLAVPGHALGSPAIGRFLQLLAGVALAAALWQWGNRHGSRWRGPAAAVVVCLTPHLLWQASTAYDDLVLALFAVAAALAAVQLPSPGRAFRSGLLIGLVAGACVAAKLHLAPYAAVLLGSWVLVQHGARGRLRSLGGAAAGAAVVALPGPLFLVAATGNPIFPQYNAVFRSSYYPLVNETYNFPYAPDGSFAQLLRLPWEALREPSLYVEAVPPSGFGMLPLLIVLALLVGWRLGRRWLPVWIALVLATAYWWLSFRYLRYAVPSMVVAVALLSQLPSPSRAHNAWRLSWSPAAGLAGLLAAVVLAVAMAPSTLASFWNIPERFPLRAALGQVDDDAYERATIGGTRLLERFNELAEPGDVLVGPLHARTLVEPELDLTPGWELTTVLSARDPLPDGPQQLRDAAHEQGVDWAVVGNGGDLSATFPLVATLVGEFGVSAYAVDNLVLYRLADRPVTRVPATPVAVCDPGFTGLGSCWGTPLDATAGLGSAEAPGGVTQKLGACPGGTYEATATAAGADGRVRVTLSAGPEPLSSLGEAAPGGTVRSVLTVPDSASELSLYVVAFAGAVAQDVSLRRTDDGPAC